VLSSIAAGQSLNGNLLGRVLDSQNRGVAGVHVQLMRPSHNVVPANSFGAITGADGRFHFIGLPAGIYLLILQVPGGAQNHRTTSLSIREAGTLDVRVTISPLQNDYSVHLIDRSIWLGRRFGFTSLQELPTSRRIWSILENQDTSTVTQPLDTAGLETGRPALFGALGASWTENQYTFNRLDLTDPYLPGRPLADPDYASIANLTTVLATKTASF